MMRYMTNEFDERFLSTNGVDDLIKIIQIKDENNNFKKYKLKIYDTAGQEKFRCLPRSYFKKADGALLLLDVNEIETFEDINVWMAEINQYGPKYEGDGSNFVIYLVGNKIDKLNNDDEEIGESNNENMLNFFFSSHFIQSTLSIRHCITFEKFDFFGGYVRVFSNLTWLKFLKFIPIICNLITACPTFFCIVKHWFSIVIMACAFDVVFFVVFFSTT